MASPMAVGAAHGPLLWLKLNYTYSLLRLDSQTGADTLGRSGGGVISHDVQAGNLN